MISDRQPSSLAAKAVLTGLAGYIGWQALGPAKQKKVLRFLDRLVEATVEAEQTRLLAEERARQQYEREAILRTLMSPSASLAPKPPTTDPVRFDFDLSSLTSLFDPKPEEQKAVEEPDARWRSVIMPPAVIVIVGKRGGASRPWHTGCWSCSAITSRRVRT